MTFVVQLTSKHDDLKVADTYAANFTGAKEQASLIVSDAVKKLLLGKNFDLNEISIFRTEVENCEEDCGFGAVRVHTFKKSHVLESKPPLQDSLVLMLTYGEQEHTPTGEQQPPPRSLEDSSSGDQAELFENLGVL